MYILRTGVLWRELPAEYGNWHTRYKRWSHNVFLIILHYLQTIKEMLMGLVPLHRHRWGLFEKNGGDQKLLVEGERA